MAVRKKRATPKSKKKIARKQKEPNVLEKGVLEEKPQAQETQKVVAAPAEAPISESVGGPVVIPSESPQLETVAPQPTQQAADTLAPQPESATKNIPSVEPIAAQDPFAVDGVVRDKPEQYIEQPKKKRSWVIIGFITVVIIFIVGVLWYFRENVMKKAPIQDEITPIPSVLKNTPTPASDSAKLTIDYSKYKIKVLNGSGIGGAAAKARDILSDEKFNIEDIGNAETSDYDLTIIQAKKEVPSAFLDRLKSVLEETYLLDANEELEDLDKVDVVIIIGSGRQPQN